MRPNIFNRCAENKLLREALSMVMYGAISALLGMIMFQIPDMQGGVSDLREIPLLIALFHMSNPLSTIILSAFSIIGSPPEVYLASYLMHQVGLVAIWYIYRQVRKIKSASIFRALNWFGLVLFYYLVFAVPILIFSTKMLGFNLDKESVGWYKDLVFALRFEIIASGMVTGMYLIQFEMKKVLEIHKEQLEFLVEERTKELAQANEELTEKNEKLQAQKEELTLTLDQLKQAQSQLIQSEKMASLGTLTAGIAHEINNPLNFIYGGVQLISDINENPLKHTAEEERERFSEALSMIRSGLERASNIVKTLTLFSSRAKPTRKPANLNKILDNVMLFLQSKICAGTIVRKEYDLTTDVPVYEGWMHQVLMNIIDNAIFAVNSQPASEANEIIIRTWQKDHTAFIQITNTGPRIPDEIMGHIFDPFFTTKDPGKGTGLGLSISYSYIAEHQGNLRAINTGEGVSFLIELPL